MTWETLFNLSILLYLKWIATYSGKGIMHYLFSVIWSTAYAMKTFNKNDRGGKSTEVGLSKKSIIFITNAECKITPSQWEKLLRLPAFINGPHESIGSGDVSYSFREMMCYENALF